MKGKTAMTGAERAKRLREARRAEGWKMVTIHLDPTTATTLAQLQTALEQSQGEVIAAGLARLAETALG